MNLRELVATLEQLDEHQIICARKPWTGASEARVVLPDASLAVPSDIERAGFAYFLEVNVASEVLRVFGNKPPTLEEEVRLLIDYAENDAYPDWVYAR